MPFPDEPSYFLHFRERHIIQITIGNTDMISDETWQKYMERSIPPLSIDAYPKYIMTDMTSQN